MCSYLQGAVHLHLPKLTYRVRCLCICQNWSQWPGIWGILCFYNSTEKFYLLHGKYSDYFEFTLITIFFHISYSFTYFFKTQGWYECLWATVHSRATVTEDVQRMDLDKLQFLLSGGSLSYGGWGWINTYWCLLISHRYFFVNGNFFFLKGNLIFSPP